MEQIIGYQYSVTGGHGYHFYQGRKLLCKVATSLISPVYIVGFGKELTSDFDLFSTIVPESARKVVDEGTKEEVATITYKSKGKYEIDNGISVTCNEEEYLFFKENRKIAQITHYAKEGLWIPKENWCELEPYFELNLYEKIDTSDLLLIAAFPALRFGMS